MNIAQTYWRKTCQLTVALLCVWFCACFMLIFFAAELQTSHFFTWPFSFYALAQGLLLFFVLLIGIYVWAMNRLERIITNATVKPE